MRRRKRRKRRRKMRKRRKKEIVHVSIRILPRPCSLVLFPPAHSVHDRRVVPYTLHTTWWVPSVTYEHMDLPAFCP